MGVIYKYKPEQFKEFVPKNDDTSVSGKNYPLSGTFGKHEFEEIIGNFLEVAVKGGKWPELEIDDVYSAEKMFDVGYLSRSSFPIPDTRRGKSGYLAYGTYMVTNEALEQILEKKNGKNI